MEKLTSQTGIHYDYDYTALQTETSKGAAGAARIVPPAFAAD